MVQQAQRQRETELAPVTRPRPRLHAYWRELVADNPIYRREQLQMTGIAVGAEKALALREERRQALALWDALPLTRKLARQARFPLGLFLVCYAVIPSFLPWLQPAMGGIFGPLFSSLVAGVSAAATTLTRERDQRTWNALLLTRLTPAQILGGKAAFALKGMLQGQLGLLAFGLALVARGLIPPLCLVLTLLITLSHGVFSTLVGLRISLWSTSVSTATRRAIVQGMVLSLLALLALFATVLPLLGIGSLWLLVFGGLYIGGTLAGIRPLWRRLLAEFYQAPKDFTG